MADCYQAINRVLAILQARVNELDAAYVKEHNRQHDLTAWSNAMMSDYTKRLITEIEEIQKDYQ